MKFAKYSLIFVVLIAGVLATMIALSVDFLWIILVLCVLVYISWGGVSAVLPIGLSRSEKSNQEEDQEAISKRLKEDKRVWFWL